MVSMGPSCNFVSCLLFLATTPFGANEVDVQYSKEQNNVHQDYDGQC